MEALAPKEEAMDDTLWPDWYIALAWAAADSVTVSSGRLCAVCGAGWVCAGGALTVAAACAWDNAVVMGNPIEDILAPFLGQDLSAVGPLDWAVGLGASLG